MAITPHLGLKEPSTTDNIATQINVDAVANLNIIDQAYGNLEDSKLDTYGDSATVAVSFEEAAMLENVATNDTHATLFGKIKKFFTFIGTTALTTTEQTITKAINELVTKLGTLSSLTTVVKTSIVDALNEVNTRAINTNLLINGDFQVWQRGTSQASSGYGSDDRWMNLNNGSTKTHSQQAFAIGQSDVKGNPKYFSRTVVTSVAGAGNYAQKLQQIEDLSRFSDVDVTLSFWAKANANKNIGLELQKYYGVGGSTTESITLSKVAVTSIWSKYTVTLHLPSLSGKTIGANSCLSLKFWFDAGSNFSAQCDNLGQQSGTFDLANIKLELGSLATPLVSRSYAEELALCQRYYINFGTGTAGKEICLARVFGADVAFGSLQLPCRMRIRPTLIMTGTFVLSQGSVDLALASVSIDIRFTASVDVHHLTLWIYMVSGGVDGKCAQLLSSQATSVFALDAEL